MTHDNNALKNAPLGKKSSYVSTYQRDLLFPIARKDNRESKQLHGKLPFQGRDIWNAYEITWLNAKGKPVAAAAQFSFDCESSHLIESKSFKLYLNSFNNTPFESFATVQNLMTRDLSEASGAPVEVKLFPLSQAPEKIVRHFSGFCLDELDITCDTYTIHPAYLTTDNDIVTETVYSDLLKSNCLVTGQPDMGSVQITYTGKQIQHAGLLKYIVSFRNINEFAEPCAETIFTDIMTRCRPEKLMVDLRYTRRGGLDINPYRANYAMNVENVRLWRQ